MKIDVRDTWNLLAEVHQDLTFDNFIHFDDVAVFGSLSDMKFWLVLAKMIAMTKMRYM